MFLVDRMISLTKAGSHVLTGSMCALLFVTHISLAFSLQTAQTAACDPDVPFIYFPICTAPASL